MATTAKSRGKARAVDAAEADAPPEGRPSQAKRRAAGDDSKDKTAEEHAVDQDRGDEDDAHPPLPDEPPPLPDEVDGADSNSEDGAPPLPDEEPPLPGASDGEDEASPLPDEEPPEEGSETNKAHPWQAVWDPARGAYYFWNSETNETTWTNPLDPASSGATGGQATAAEASAPAGPQPSQKELFEQTTGVDADLAYLDPTLATAMSSGGGSAAAGANLGYRAMGHFDARKGKFVPQAAAAYGAGGQYDPTRMTHAAQANRQMEAFFDTESWQHDLEKRRREEQEAEARGEKKPRVTKKDLERFRERKKEKKRAQLSWLRD